MRTSAFLAALAFTAGSAYACGICVEDRVAAVFDNAVVDQAIGARRHVAFYGVEGSLPATKESRRALLDALYASGAAKGSARVSLESASVSAAFDPGRTTLTRLGNDAARRLAPNGLGLTPLRVIDEGGVLKASTRQVSPRCSRRRGGNLSRMDAETGADVNAREVHDLRNTIAALRDSVERMRIERDKVVQEAVAASHQEVAQLKATTAALRQALEEERNDKERQIREAVRNASDEIKQLKAVIAAIRESLEKARS